MQELVRVRITVPRLESRRQRSALEGNLGATPLVFDSLRMQSWSALMLHSFLVRLSQACFRCCWRCRVQILLLEWSPPS